MRRLAWRVLSVLWLAGAVVTWNLVFDANVRAGSHDYLERQELFVQGRGQPADIDVVMGKAVSRGLHVATLSALAWLSPAIAVALARRRRRGRAG
jgi:hypothetical protein